MSNKTYGDLLDYVKKTLDLQEEIFITSSELGIYVEEAIKYCESEAHKLNIEDQYFVTMKPIAMVQGQSEYDLPSNVYGNKILRLMYNDGSRIYAVPRIRNMNRFERGTEIDYYNVNTEYGYMLVNHDIRSGTKIRLFPRSNESSVSVSTTGNLVASTLTITGLATTTGIQPGYFVSGTGLGANARVASVDSASQVTLETAALTTGTAVTLTFTEPKLVCWYIREAAVPAASTDYIDFPEFWNFIAQHMIVQCLAKELGNPRLATEQAKLEALKEQVISTLANMVPDQDDTVEKDMSFYADSSVEWGFN